MKKSFYLIALIIFGLLLSTCQEKQPKNLEENTVLQFGLDHPVISEIATGIAGNNNHDFIELYNPQPEPYDLNHHALWFQLEEGEEHQIVIRWQEETIIPPYGHYLLVREKEDFGLIADLTISQPLVPSKGILWFEDGKGNELDRLGWGNIGEGLSEGDPAPKVKDGHSLERLPGGGEGNQMDTDDNHADFQLNSAPDPQNTGSQISPDWIQHPSLSIEIPGSVEPGQQFSITVTLDNPTETSFENISVDVPLPAELEILNTEEYSTSNNLISWTVDEILPGGRKVLPVQATAPWKIVELEIKNANFSADNLPISIFTQRSLLAVEGGVVPIEVARTLEGSELSVEGIVTMYPDGFYAGSGAKFYLQDETAGIQVYVTQAQGALNYPIGAKVRVQGIITPYRGSLELVPTSKDQIELISPKDLSNVPVPVALSVQEAVNGFDLLEGLLVEVQGSVARVEEISYSYEIDLLDDLGNRLTVYIDKETHINIDNVETGKEFNLTGILEEKDGMLYLNPRVQEDITDIIPAVLIIQPILPLQIPEVGNVRILFEVWNHTGSAVQTVQAEFFSPLESTVIGVSQNGQVLEGVILWDIGEMGVDENTEVWVDIEQAGEYIQISDYQVSSADVEQISVGETVFAFYSEIIPIWAIQGNGYRSPYKGQVVVTQGIVTAVFPELSGFWIQNPSPDDDETTSEGLFVNTDELEILYEVGDRVEVYGEIRESFQQTHIYPFTQEDISLISEHQAVPKEVLLNLPHDPEDAPVYWESLEGMLVTYEDELRAVSPINQYGESYLIPQELPQIHVFRGNEIGEMICIDDGSSQTYQYQESVPYLINTGDQVSGITGVVAYSYGVYKIELTQIIEVDTVGIEVNPLSNETQDEIRVMTWNVESLFDYLEPHPSSPEMPSYKEYKLAVQKTAHTIFFAGAPSIVGLQEIENINVLEDIAEQDVLSGFNYEAYLLEGTDSRGIDVGFLVRGDVEILEVTQYPTLDGLTNRPPLGIFARVGEGDNAREIFILNNHFTSMSEGEEITEPRRLDQAKWNLEVISLLREKYPEVGFVILGDLNSYRDSLPVEYLERNDFFVTWDIVPESERYSYIYQGVAQILDYILVSDDLVDDLSWAKVLHINADSPPPMEGDSSYLGKSDHDPLIISVSIR
ncbi:MAG: endonuclease/exonuclease/phosphatase family protein [Anaerolineales bacterium]|nr:endonuclease/exonuclease/phosphatase family protein [Anaerolineales bacterium]